MLVARPLALALLLVGFSAAARAAEPSYDDPVLRTRITTLPNGLTVLTLPDPATPVVSFQVWVKVGSGDESRFTGIAHLFEHLMFLGSKNLAGLGPEAYTRLVEERGGQINASTSRDVTTFYEDVAPEHLPLIAALEGERFQNLTISDEALKSERQVVIEERRLRNENDPEGRAFEMLMALTYQAHPYRVPTVGWVSDLDKVSVKELREFFDTYYAANNLVVAIAGAFDTDETLALVTKTMGGLPRAETIPRNPQEEPPQDGERRAVIHVPVKTPLLLVGWPAPPTGHPDGDALDVAANLLSKGRTSRLYRALVYDAPLALAPESFYWELQRAGLFMAGATLRPDVPVERAERALFAEIDRLGTTPPSDDELARAKRALEVAWIRGQGSAHALATRIAQDYVAYGRLEPLAEKLDGIRKVTGADVQRVVREYLTPARRNIVQVQPAAEVTP
jgi:zinc protease